MSNDVVWWIAFIAFGYLSGSIPFGLLIGKFKGIDIREHGSGNIGATNAGRVLGRTAGGVCFALDVLKGAIPVDLAAIVMNLYDVSTITPARSAWWFAVAAATMLGHMYPVWLRFKGGKGVATGFGALGGMWPIVSIATVASLLVWIFSVRITKYVGVSSCLAAGLLPVFVIATALAWRMVEPSDHLRSHWPAIAFAAGLAGVVIWRHRGNIQRTLKGVESKTHIFG